MPWTADDAPRHNRKANTPARKRLWARVATKALAETGAEGRALRIANGALKRVIDQASNRPKGTRR